MRPLFIRTSLALLVVLANVTTRGAFAAQDTSLADTALAFSNYDMNGDGIIEIESLQVLGIDQPVDQPRTGTVLILVEPRLLTGPGSIELIDRLTRWRDDMASEGYNPRFLGASVYSGPVHQDGRTILALREFLKASETCTPSLGGVVLVGAFPEATLLLTWMQHIPEPTFSGRVGKHLVVNKGLLKLKVDRITPSSDLVLGDLDGNWHNIYQQEATPLHQWQMVLDSSALSRGPVANSTISTNQYEYVPANATAGVTPPQMWADYFDIRDADVTTLGPTPAGLLTVNIVSMSARNAELAASDFALRNPIARPELAVSRINARNISLQPDAPPDVHGRRPLTSQGTPQALEYVGPASIGFVRDPGLEKRLLVDYFDRQHRFRSSTKTRPPWRASSIQTDPALSSTTVLNALLEKCGFGFEPELATTDADIVDYAAWMLTPAALRGVAAHANWTNTAFAGSSDTAILEALIGPNPYAWAQTIAGDRTYLTPSVTEFRGADWALHRTIWNNRVMPHTSGSVWFHQGCDLIIPENSETMPYSDASYGGRQNAESILFYLDAVAIFGRGKVFYDLPTGAPPAIRTGRGRVGEGWKGIFFHDSMVPSTFMADRKKAYFWSLLGDLTLLVKPDETPPSFAVTPVAKSRYVDRYRSGNSFRSTDLAQVEYSLQRREAGQLPWNIPLVGDPLGVYDAPFLVDIDKTLYRQGYYYLIADGGDESGNYRRVVSTILLDTQPPTVDLANVSAGSVSGAVSVQLRATDNFGITKAAWSLRKNGDMLEYKARQFSPSVLSFDYFENGSVAATSGTFEFRVRVRDGASETYIQKLVDLDMVNPVIDDVTASLQRAGDEHRFSIQVRAHDDVGIRFVSWLLFKDSLNVGRRSRSLSTPSLFYSESDVRFFDSSFGYGNYQLVIDVTDSSGRLSQVSRILHLAPPPSGPSCNDSISSNGGNLPETHIIDVGRSYGKFWIHYDTFDIPDEMVISCADGGTVEGVSLFTLGCVGTVGVNSVQLGFSGSSDRIEVRIYPNCLGTSETQWNFTIDCATQ